jgi:hypothetical protein
MKLDAVLFHGGLLPDRSFVADLYTPRHAIRGPNMDEEMIVGSLSLTGEGNKEKYRDRPSFEPTGIRAGDVPMIAGYVFLAARLHSCQISD